MPRSSRTSIPFIRISSSPVTSVFASFTIFPSTVTPPFFRTAFTSLRLPAPELERYLSSLILKHLQFLPDFVSSLAEYFIREPRSEGNDHIDKCAERHCHCKNND